MAIQFVAASTEFLLSTITPYFTVPITLACWFQRASSHRGTMIQLTRQNAGNAYFALMVEQVTNEVRCDTRGGGGHRITLTTTSSSQNTWHHACGVFTSTTFREVYLDAGGLNSSTDVSLPDTDSPILTAIGRHVDDSPGFEMNGIVAEVGIWNVALTAAEVSILAAGYSPLFVRPASLIAYYPLLDQATPSIDLIAGNNLTWNSTPDVANHPRRFYPRRKHIIMVPAAAPSAEEFLGRQYPQGVLRGVMRGAA